MLRTTPLLASIAIGILTSTGIAQAQLWLEPRCKPLPFTNVTQLVKLRDGSLLTIEGAATKITSDDGHTWSAPRTIYDGPAPGIPTQDYSILLRTKAGTLLVVYMDASTEKWDWDNAKNTAAQDARLDVWAIRSLDEGQTWIDRQKILDGYCGAVIGMIQTSTGQIVVPVQNLAPDRNRHVTLTCVSADDGRTWLRGNIIDLGGCGDHDGAYEGTVAELSTGRLMMLLRTTLGRFWETYSDDGGRYWREIRPSQIDAFNAPGYLLRLASGRLALVWNRLHAERPDSNVPPGWQRGELSLALSDDDAKTWTKPVVIARQRAEKIPDGLAYAFIFERRPGELWVGTRFPTKVCFKLAEADFVNQK